MTAPTALDPGARSTSDGERDPAGPRLALDLVAWMVALKVLVHVPGLTRYGYYLDEIGYLVTGQHLQWGYITFAPLFPVLAWVVNHLGAALPTARVVSLALGVSIVVSTMGMAWRLGGGGWPSCWPASRPSSRGSSWRAVPCSPAPSSTWPCPPGAPTCS